MLLKSANFLYENRYTFLIRKEVVFYVFWVGKMLEGVWMWQKPLQLSCETKRDEVVLKMSTYEIETDKCKTVDPVDLPVSV